MWVDEELSTELQTAREEAQPHMALWENSLLPQGSHHSHSVLLRLLPLSSGIQHRLRSPIWTWLGVACEVSRGSYGRSGCLLKGINNIYTYGTVGTEFPDSTTEELVSEQG